MGSAAFGVSEPEDSENGRGMLSPDVTPVVLSMHRQAGRVTAGTCQLMQLQSIDTRKKIRQSRILRLIRKTWQTQRNEGSQN